MKINKVHCLFEQSGTFKNEWRKLGYEAYDYDIQNEYGQTDYQIDIFSEINAAWGGQKSIFDNIMKEDLVMAFFPCIYFETLQMTYYDLTSINLRSLSKKEKYEVVLERIKNRETFYILLWKLYAICDTRELKLIIENPTSGPTYLNSFQNFPKPTIVDRNRSLRGDYYVKPTAYWFVNLTPTHGESYCINTNVRTTQKAKKAPKAGICSAERSMISPTYARNFICDFIVGQPNEYTQPTLF